MDPPVHVAAAGREPTIAGVDEVRVLLLDLPRMLREVVRNVLDAHPGVTVVAVRPFPVSVLDAVDEAGADLVVLGQGAQHDAGIRELLERRPRVPLVSISADGRQASVSGLRPYREPLGEVDGERLVETIRDAVAASAGW
jgi:chemotaxis response regulator CheB